MNMLTVLSLATSAKDYFEIVHKLLELHPNYNIIDYNEVGSIISYFMLTIKSFFAELFSLNWFHSLWSIPIIVPDISSAMISEISVLDGFFHNAFTFLETPVSYGKQNSSLYGLEKFTIGLINSFFLFLPTSAAHIILLRRFVFQGIEAGYLAGIGIIAGNVLWLTCIIFGWRFFVIPWLSLDIFRYLLGFVILIKYMWHASRDERRTSVTTNLSKSKIVLINLLLALTEQTSIYPFVTNISVSAESSILETFPVDNLTQFILVHSAYIAGILVGSLSLLHLTCWVWENPIYRLYIWFITNSSLSLNVAKGPKKNFYKYLNFSFLYLTMLCSISSIPYFGLDYTITNPLGFSYDDRILYQKNKKTNLIPETAFLSSQASDRNTRDSRGRHGRRERWKERLIKYRGMDTSLYDQGVYDLFTIEDLNYGFDKFWLRRKIKNHHSRFRMVIFQPWLLSLKKQLAKPRLISNEGVRVELFRMLYEQFYHPNFHAYLSIPPSSVAGEDWQASKKRETFFKPGDAKNLIENKNNALAQAKPAIAASIGGGGDQKALTILNSSEKNATKNTVAVMNAPFFNVSLTANQKRNAPNGSMLSLFGSQSRAKIDNKLIKEFSALRKLVRKINTRMKSSEILLKKTNLSNLNKPIYSKLLKRASPVLWEQFLSKIPSFSAKITKINNSSKVGKKEKMPVYDFKENWQKINLPRETRTMSQSLQRNSVLDVSSVNDWRNTLNSPYNTRNNIKTNYMHKEKLTKKERQLWRYKQIFSNSSSTLVPATPPLTPYPPYGGSKGYGSLSKRKGEMPQLTKPKTIQTNFLETFNNAKTMLHPIKFYLQKEKAFRRKLHFYGASIFRKFAIENNAPYFRIMMKRLFYYYKPTLRWTNTLKFARNKQGHKVRRKKSRTPLFFQPSPNANGSNVGGAISKEQLIALPLLPTTGVFKGATPNPTQHIQQTATEQVEKTALQMKLPTHPYRVVGKNASRYRYQIYKDVLQHWYYTPFNRLLLKFDVDSFIRRQPNSHFLSTKEEHLLHLKRYLLAEHYETLRWYTYMQHYRSMKTQIGGTKSFASRMYNHQFQGTFKKIRHLFAITPSLLSTETSAAAGILKYDQPLYNEYSNTEQKSITKTSVTHEELFLTSNKQSLSLLANPNQNDSKKFTPALVKHGESETKWDESSYVKNPFSKAAISKTKIKDDLITQSTLIVREYLKISKPIRQAKIKHLILSKNYKELTQFLFSGQKNRGIKPITNQRSLLNQEKTFLYNTTELEELNQKKGNLFLEASSSTAKNSETLAKQDLWFNLLNNYKKGLYDQEYLTKFIERRIKKREKRQQKKEKELKNRVKRLKIWLEPNQLSLTNLNLGQEQLANTSELTLKDNFDSAKKGLLSKAIEKDITPDFLTTGIKNAIKDGLDINTFSNSFLAFPSISFYRGEDQAGNKVKIGYTKQEGISETVNNSLQSISSIFKKLNNNQENDLVTLALPKNKKTLFSSTKKSLLTAFIKTKVISQSLQNKIKSILELIVESPSSKKLAPISKKDPKWWDLKDKMLKKRKRSRKKYTKEIKKAQTTFINLVKEQKKEAEKKVAELQTKQMSSALIKADDTLVQKNLNNQAFANPFFLGVDNKQDSKKLSFTPIQTDQNQPLIAIGLTKQKQASPAGLASNPNSNFAGKQTSLKAYTISNFSKKMSMDVSMEPLAIGELKQRKKIITDNEIQIGAKDPIEHLSFPVFLSLNLNAGKEKNKKLAFLYLNTLYGKKYEIKQQFRRKKTKNRRNQRFGRPHHRVEHPSYNSTLERKSANMLPEKRLETLKDQALLNRKPKPESLIDSELFTLHTNFPKKRKSKKRNWKKYKKGINSEKTRKARKQNRDAIALQRAGVLSKQIKRIKLILKLQQWWWQKFLPRIQATAEATWQLEKDRQLTKTISKLSKTEILERDYRNTNQDSIANLTYPEGVKNLQVGDYDFKPLVLPQALRIRDALINQNVLKIEVPKLSDMNDSSLTIKTDTPLALPHLPRSLPSDALQSKREDKSVGSVKKEKPNNASEDNGLNKLKNVKNQTNSLFYRQNNRLLLCFGKLKKNASNIPQLFGFRSTGPLSSPYIPSSNHSTFSVVTLGQGPQRPQEGAKEEKDLFFKSGFDNFFISNLYKKLFNDFVLNEQHSLGSSLLTNELNVKSALPNRNSLTPSNPIRFPVRTPFKLISNVLETVEKTSAISPNPHQRWGGQVNSLNQKALPIFAKPKKGKGLKNSLFILPLEKDFSLLIQKRNLNAKKKLKGPRLEFFNKFLVQTNSLPFYAGWDESLRKFVVTNRFLSRRDAGYSVTLLSPKGNTNNGLTNQNQSSHSKMQSKIDFTSAPLQGMNAGTTLYCQVPFTTFDPDQLFSKGMDGFAPIGWRRFEFTHSIFKKKTKTNAWRQLRSTKTKSNSTSLPFFVKIKKQGFSPLKEGGSTAEEFQNLKPLLIKQITIPQINNNSQEFEHAYAPTDGAATQSIGVSKRDPIGLNFWLYKSEFNPNALNSKVLDKLTNRAQTLTSKAYSSFKTIKQYNYYSRRLKKHYKRIKKLQNEKVPVFLMSGPLITEVLPIHYINVFNKQNRLSRDRYLKRRLRRGKKGVPKAIKEFNTTNANPLDPHQRRGSGVKIDSYVALLSNGSKSQAISLPLGGQSLYDFTLRRRIKTRRKYHRKPPNTKGIEVRPRRHKFFAFLNTKSFLAQNSLISTGTLNNTKNSREKKKPIRKRPSKRQTKKKQSNLTPPVGGGSKGLENQKAKNARDYDGGVSTKARQRKNIKKTGALNARLRQLRRRVSRQVIKPVPRRRPRSGGFLWPGDYLRLEQTESPKLLLKHTKASTSSLNDDTLALKDLIPDTNKQKITRKIEKKAILLDLYVQPRKYLLEKHNIQVIKKKLEKAQRTNKIRQRIKEFLSVF